jgi:hypothetical protein
LISLAPIEFSEVFYYTYKKSNYTQPLNQL